MSRTVRPAGYKNPIDQSYWCPVCKSAVDTIAFRSEHYCVPKGHFICVRANHSFELMSCGGMKRWGYL